MRNPDRIDIILNKMRAVRSTYPDMRYGQLLVAIGYLNYSDVEQDFKGNMVLIDPFHYEDDRLEKCLDKFILEKNILDI